MSKNSLSNSGSSGAGEFYEVRSIYGISSGKSTIQIADGDFATLDIYSFGLAPKTGPFRYSIVSVADPTQYNVSIAYSNAGEILSRMSPLTNGIDTEVLSGNLRVTNLTGADAVFQLTALWV